MYERTKSKSDTVRRSSDVRELALRKLRRYRVLFHVGVTIAEARD